MGETYMKKLSKRENQIMIALWNSSVPLSASALKKNLDEDVNLKIKFIKRRS